MKIILFSKGSGRTRRVDFSRPSHLISALSTVAVLLSIPLFSGYLWASHVAAGGPNPQIEALREELVTQKTEIRDAREEVGDDLDAIAVRIGKVQSHVIRLDALGRRLTEMADLEQGEFNFEIPPAQGGPESSGEDPAIEAPELVAMLVNLERQITNRERQLTVLEDVLINQNLSAQVHPAGRPVTSGYMSSYFGYRADPFTGRKAWHKGVDFAGKMGADIRAVAAGIVTWSGDRYGYGRMIEIDHGNGYVTRYAHNKANLVNVGDKIEKGQAIATMGSTGRATGPNLHFEVLHQGRVVNPRKYVD